MGSVYRDNVKEFKCRNFSINSNDNDFKITIELENGEVMNFIKTEDNNMESSEYVVNDQSFALNNKSKFNTNRFYYIIVVTIIIVTLCFVLSILLLNFPSIFY